MKQGQRGSEEGEGAAGLGSVLEIFLAEGIFPLELQPLMLFLKFSVTLARQRL